MLESTSTEHSQITFSTLESARGYVWISEHWALSSKENTQKEENISLEKE